MLHSVRNLHGSALHAVDGEIGRVQQAFFDDEAWGIRYLVVKTGSWLFGREVLISPLAVQKIDDAANKLDVNLTQKQVQGSPDIDTHKPVSRQHEIDYSGYYGYAPYWGGPYMSGVTEYPIFTPIPPAAEDRARAAHETEVLPEDSHLRSTDQVEGYRLHAPDGDIGHVTDFIFDDESWTIRYLAIDTQDWWPHGKTVLIATQWIESIDWGESAVRTGLSREAIKNGPVFDDPALLNRDDEIRLHEFHGKEGYWR
jgi:hypothetical protein